MSPGWMPEVEVGQLGALRLAGGAGGIEDHRGVVLVGVGEGRLGLAVAEQLGEGLGLDLDQLRPGLGGSLPGLLGEAVPGEQQLRAGVLEVEGDLAPLQEHVHRHHDAAGAEDAVVADRELEHVRQHQPDSVAPPQALLAQQRGEPGAVVVELAVGQLERAEADGDRRRGRGGGIGDDRRKVQAHLSSSDCSRGQCRARLPPTPPGPRRQPGAPAESGRKSRAHLLGCPSAQSSIDKCRSYCASARRLRWRLVE
jgi:hypothetical protein